jgi:DtxR family Mn-dependent transcriptional regulator
VHAEACKLEHAISERVEERLIAVLGDPSVCPHGHPIPSHDRAAPPRCGLRLAEALPGSTVRIVEVVEDEPEMLRLLAAAGLRPGATATVVEHPAPGAPVTVESAAGRTAIPIELARLVAIAAEADSALSA